MALGRIIRDENFVYINGETLYDVQSVSSSLTLNNSVLNVAGHGAIGLVNEGVLNGSISLDRLAINNDPFTGIFAVPFSGVWHYIDSDKTDRHFTMHSGYISEYGFSAQVQQIPTITTQINAYGNMIGGSQVETGNITTDLDGFLDNYIAPKGINLTFTEGTTNRVQSFDLSISVQRNVRNRLGQMLSIPENFVSYPISAQLSIDIDVDQYSAPRIDSLICRDKETISLELTNCNGSGIRGFTFESGSLESVNLSASADGSSNTATLQYVKNINDINNVQNIFT
ncbi:MAG: hypothetical protein ACW99F_00320 [Candidatus Hodarchaeales archaeon]|jgi:hypothetical protein